MAGDGNPALTQRQIGKDRPDTRWLNFNTQVFAIGQKDLVTGRFQTGIHQEGGTELLPRGWRRRAGAHGTVRLGTALTPSGNSHRRYHRHPAGNRIGQHCRKLGPETA